MTTRIAAVILFCFGCLQGTPADAGDSKPSPKKLRVFESERGGFKVSIPETWHTKEVESEGAFQAFLSREPILGESDKFKVGVSITRLDDFRRGFQFTSSSPELMAAEFANRTAAALSKSGRNLVVSLPQSMNTQGFSQFRISVDGGTPDCLSVWLQVKIEGTKWFHALWEKPCQDTQLDNKKIESIMKQLRLLQAEK